MKGYKAFEKDLTCRGFQYKVGRTYTHKGKIEVCGEGFHFCEKLENVYGYYERSSDTRVCEVEALGEVLTEGDKSCTNKIKILRELKGKELLNAVLKDNNSGYYNSGDYNSGYYNSGDYNSGNRNSGHYNSGHRNSGHCNSGSCNSGDYNSGDYNSGYFNTNTPTVRLFNKDSRLKFDSEKIDKLRNVIYKVKPVLQWVSSDRMTEEEKTNNPSHKTTGGYLKNTGRQCWSNVTDDDLKFIASLPNFSPKIFEELTGIKLDKKGNRK